MRSTEAAQYILTPRFRYNSTPLSETTHHAYAFVHRMSMTPHVRLVRVRMPGHFETALQLMCA